MAPSRESTSFTWDSCDGLDDRRRIKIKEEALQLGIEQCKQLISQFDTPFFTDKESNDELYSNVFGHKIIKGWIDSCSKYLANREGIQAKSTQRTSSNATMPFRFLSASQALLEVAKLLL